MSTLKTDAIESATGTNTNLALTGKGTGKVAIGDAALLFPDADGSSSGDVLQTNASGVLSFTTPSAGGAWTYISSVTASSSATVDFTSGIGSTYDLYMVTWADVVPVSDNVDYYIRTSTSGAFSSGASDYDYYTSRWQTGTGSHSTAATSTGAQMAGPSGNGSAAGEGMTGWLMFGSPDNTALNKNFIWHWTMTDNSGNTVICPGGGARMATAAIDGIQFFFSSGNVESGTFRLYGIANS